MLKFVQLKFSKIKYRGDSIGRDIRIEIDALDKTSKINKRISSGETKEINQEIYRIETNVGLLQSDISITVIEKDLLFNDVGNIKGNIEIDTVSKKPQRFVFEVEVKENRSLLSKLFWGGRKAIFEVELEAQVGDIVRYIPEITNGDGWLLTKNEKEESVSLPAYLKVEIKYVKNGREYFVPLEGTNRGRLLSLELNDGSSHLISNVQHEPAANATYAISKKIFTLNGRQYKTIDYPKAPWKKGIYNIEIPDYPHGSNNAYIEAVRQKVWFPIYFESARYLHVGARSAGCMTITETARWMEIYSVLIKARKGDGKNVGIVSVVE